MRKERQEQTEREIRRILTTPPNLTHNNLIAQIRREIDMIGKEVHDMGENGRCTGGEV